MSTSLRWRRPVLVLVLATAVCLWLTRDHLTAVHGPDGIRITLLGVSYGTNHFAPPLAWSRLKAALPQRLADWIGLVRPVPTPTMHPALVVWLEFNESAERSHTTLEFEWIDSHESTLPPGFEPLSDFAVMTASGRSWSASAPTSRGRQRALLTRVFPRRKSPMRLRVFLSAGPDSRRIVGDLAMANPLKQPYPVWSADDLPAQRENDGVKFVLDEFTVTPPRPGERRVALVGLQVVGKGQELDGWALDSLELEDPTGNRIRPELLFSGLPDRDQLLHPRDPTGAWTFGFPWPGWTSEPTWRMNLQLRPGKPDSLAPGDDCLTLRGLVVPGPEGVTRIDRCVSLAGHDFTVVALVGEHATFPDRSQDVCGLTTLELELPALPAGWCIEVVDVESQHGRVEIAGVWGGQKRSVGLVNLQALDTVDVTLAAFRMRHVSFTVSE